MAIIVDSRLIMHFLKTFESKKNAERKKNFSFFQKIELFWGVAIM
jgi:hypothetical protein